MNIFFVIFVRVQKIPNIIVYLTTMHQRYFQGRPYLAFHLNSSIAIFQYIYCEPFPKIYELLFCYPQSVNNEKNLNFRTINLQCLPKQFALLKTFSVYIFAWSPFYKNIVIGKILRFLVKIISIQNGIQTYLKIFSISLLNRNGVNKI